MALQPASLWDQFEGKAVAALQRGNGWWPLQPDPVPLEPPFDPHVPDQVTAYDCLVNNWQVGYHGGYLVYDQNEGFAIPADPTDYYTKLNVITVKQYPDDTTTIRMADQLLHALQTVHYPISFEIVASGGQPEYDNERYLAEVRIGNHQPLSDYQVGWKPPYTRVQFGVRDADLPLLEQQLQIAYPASAIVVERDAWQFGDITIDLHDHPKTGQPRGWAATLALQVPYAYPLRTYTSYDPDPLLVALGGLENLEPGDWSILQILFHPAVQPWPHTLIDAISNPYKENEFLFDDLNDMRPLLKQKFDSPLFAVSVCIATNRREVFRHLTSWAALFDNAPHQRLVCNNAEWPDDSGPPEYERELLENALNYRCAYRPGMILNTAELSSLMHIPATGIAAERLERTTTRTAKAVATETGIVLGINEHRGKQRIARIPEEMRMRHLYTVGSTGTGKTTLLRNLIAQDVAAGHGLAVFDPHGDMIEDVLRNIPQHRADDVIYFDPNDSEYPFGLNLLELKDKEEQPRLVSELLKAFERIFANWGVRIEQTLRFSINVLLDVLDHPTIADIERLLTSKEYREAITSRTTNQRYRDFWAGWKYSPQTVDPVLNKLSPLLDHPTIRNILCQQQSQIDFDHVINHRKILLCKLSSGLLTEGVADVLGSFIIVKLVNAAFRRQRIPEQFRVPFYCYIDEFQVFVNASSGVSFERLLSETRKYRLSLTMANQFFGQLTPAVRDAVIGNVGTMAFFRVGTGDARQAASELGPFEPQEITDLGLGECLVRVEKSSQSFNVKTNPPPAPAEADLTSYIINRTRQLYARPKGEIEKELAQAASVAAVAPALPPDPDDVLPVEKPKKTPQKKRNRPKRAIDREPPIEPQQKPPPVDPSPDDLID